MNKDLYKRNDVLFHAYNLSADTGEIIIIQWSFNDLSELLMLFYYSSQLAVDSCNKYLPHHMYTR